MHTFISQLAILEAGNHCNARRQTEHPIVFTVMTFVMGKETVQMDQMRRIVVSNLIDVYIQLPLLKKN